MFQPKYEDKINRTLQKDEKKSDDENSQKATDLSESCLAKTKIVGTNNFYHTITFSN